jgi:hypothetical protein
MDGTVTYLESPDQALSCDQTPSPDQIVQREKSLPADFSQRFAVSCGDNVEDVNSGQTSSHHRNSELKVTKRDSFLNVTVKSDVDTPVSSAGKQQSRSLVQMNTTQSSGFSMKKRSPNILSRKRPSKNHLDNPVECQVDEHNVKELDVYDFDEEETATDRNSKSRSNKRKHLKGDDEFSSILRAKQRRSSLEGIESFTVSTGSALKLFLANHPLLLGLYMNKGKRQVKHNFVTMKRDTEAIDKGSWTRGSKVMTRNRLDDHFELTPEGVVKLLAVERKEVRDQRVVCWYMWCPGHGNCLRQCQEYGKCIQGLCLHMLTIYL